MEQNRLQQVLVAIDSLNRQDPSQEEMDGRSIPKELAYSVRLTDWVKRLEPHSSETLQIAARGQHVQRWTIPRSRYPDDRKGYLQWRQTLKEFHAKTVTALMRQAGYGEAAILQVEQIILKKNVREPETQIIEDALCLVFLETQFAPLRETEPDEKMIEILRKTWRKMGEKGRAEALKLKLPEPEKELLEKALR